MSDYYEILGIEKDAQTEEIPAAFEALLTSRRAKRQRTSDLHAALAVLADPILRTAYDAVLAGKTSAGVGGPKGAVGEAALLVRDVISEIDVEEVARQAWQLTLKTVVVVSGTTAKAADVTGTFARTVQVAAAKRLSSQADLPAATE